MAGYLGAIPVPQATQHRESFTATAGQTTFNTAGYTVGFVDVYLNGVHLTPADVTATNGSDVVIGACLVNDIVDVISYTAFEVANQTFTGTTTMDVAAITGVLTTTAATVFNGGFSANDGSTITTADNTAQLNLVSTDADAAIGPLLIMKRDSSSPAADDQMGKIRFVGEDSTDAEVVYSEIVNQIKVATNNNEEGRMAFNVMSQGTGASFINMTHSSNQAETVFNDESRDIDFRVESNNDTHALFVEGSSGNVGIGVTPADSNSFGIALDVGSATGAALYLRDVDGSKVGIVGQFNEQLSINSKQSDGNIGFYTGASNTERMRIDSSGNLLKNTTSTISTGSNSDTGIQLGANNQAIFIATGGPAVLIARNGSTGEVVRFGNQGTGDVGSIDVTTSSTSYNTSSDYRLKTDVQPMTGASARVQALNPVNFEWIADGTRVDGFLAHEAATVVPEAVTGTKDAMMDEEYEVTPAVLDADGNETKKAVMGTRSVPDMQGIDQSKMVPLLVAALQEALARITALENA